MATRMADEDTPLLEANPPAVVLVKRTPVPWRALISLLLLNAAAPLAFELIFPFINQMLLELGIVKDVERVGFYSGVIESIFSIMSLVTILPTSYASDRIGRKPVILFGMGGMALSTICFGMSRSYLTLILSRCLGGALGGAWAAIRVMLGEMTDRSNQSVAFTGLTISYRIGQIVGLPLGGYLSHPERLSPILFGGEFWRTYPFALPCFFGAGFAIAAVFLGSVYIKETLPKGKQFDPQTETATLIDVPIIPSLSNEAEEHFSDQPALRASGQPSKKVKTPSFTSVLSKPVLAILVSNICMCLLSELLFSIYPLFAFTPVNLGGLGLNEAEIGTHLSLRSFLHIGIMFTFTPLHILTGRESAVRIYQASMVLWPVCVGFYPLLSWMAKTGTGGGVGGFGFNCVVAIFFLIWSFASFGWSAVSMLINDAAPSASALAAIIGIFQMSIVLPQAIAPAASTSLFAISIRNPDILNGNLVWVIFFVLGCAGALQTLMLKEPTHDWRLDEATAKAGAASN